MISELETRRHTHLVHRGLVWRDCRASAGLHARESADIQPGGPSKIQSQMESRLLIFGSQSRIIDAGQRQISAVEESADGAVIGATYGTSQNLDRMAAGEFAVRRSEHNAVKAAAMTAKKS